MTPEQLAAERAAFEAWYATTRSAIARPHPWDGWLAAKKHAARERHPSFNKAHIFKHRENGMWACVFPGKHGVPFTFFGSSPKDVYHTARQSVIALDL